VLPDFITFASTVFNPVVVPDAALDLTFIYKGVHGQGTCGAGPLPGQTCTPLYAALQTASNLTGISPYNFENLAGNTSSLSITVRGNLRRISTGETTPFIGILSTSFTSPFQTILADILGKGSDNSYAATFAASDVPEPGTGILLAAGGLLVLAARVRKSKAAL